MPKFQSMAIRTARSLAVLTSTTRPVIWRKPMWRIRCVKPDSCGPTRWVTANITKVWIPRIPIPVTAKKWVNLWKECFSGWRKTIWWFKKYDTVMLILAETRLAARTGAWNKNTRVFRMDRSNSVLKTPTVANRVTLMLHNFFSMYT